MDNTEDLIAALAPVVYAMRRLDIAFYVGGSVASSYHGATRSTMDVDIVCNLDESNIRPLIELVGSDFYSSETAINEAMQRKSCLNLIHLPTSFKVDVFVSRLRPFDIEAMKRAVIGRLGEMNSIEVPIATVEDSIVSKLEWYRLTDETSDRQWNDVSRLLDLLGDHSNQAYLTRAAESVGVADLLKRLIDAKNS